MDCGFLFFFLIPFSPASHTLSVPDIRSNISNWPHFFPPRARRGAILFPIPPPEIPIPISIPSPFFLARRILEASPPSAAVHRDPSTTLSTVLLLRPLKHIQNG